MDFSSANTLLWDPIIQIGIIAAVILLANVLRRKIGFIQKSLMPTAVLAGFIMLLIRAAGFDALDPILLEKITYHALAIGFIALSLRTPEEDSGSGALIGSRSGALIVSTYLVQGITGLVISIGLAYTFMPDLFKASGILLPMAYGQGPGQANNVGTTYQALGMDGGRAFGLSLAAVGYLCACIVGVVFLNIYSRQGKLKRAESKEEISGSVTIDTFQSNNEIPIAESIDRLSIQAALVAMIYLCTYYLICGISSLIGMAAPGVVNTVATLLWGFNFIIGSMIAILCRSLFKNLRYFKIMNHQYQNNYLLSRMSGLAFDLMIVAGIASINIEDISGYLLPFALMAAAGGAATFLYLSFMTKKLYPDYRYEGFFSMYGMLTGTISSGILLLREIDPELKTPAANNLVAGSSFGIVFGAPVLLLVSMAAQNDLMAFVVLFLLFVYLAALLLFIFKAGSRRSKKQK